MAKEIDRQKLITSLDTAYTDKKDPLIAAYTTLKKLLDEGYSGESIKKLLTDYMLVLRDKGDEKKEDFVMDCLDFLVGWCAPKYDLSNKLKYQ